MKFFIVLFTIVAAASAVEEIYEYVADQKIDPAIYEKFSTHHVTLTHGVVIDNILPEDRSAIDDKLMALIENAREQFEIGFPESGIPPLEPISIDNLYFYIYQKWVASLDTNFDGVKIAGLKKLIINNLTFKIVGLTLEFDLSLPDILATSTYRINGKIGTIIPFNPRGDARVDLTGVNIRGLANLGTTDGYLNLKAFKVDFDIQKIKIYLSGLLGDGLINKFLNWILSKISVSVINAQKEKITAAASKFVLELADGFLKDIKLSDLIG